MLNTMSDICLANLFCSVLVSLEGYLKRNMPDIQEHTHTHEHYRMTTLEGGHEDPLLHLNNIFRCPSFTAGWPLFHLGKGLQKKELMLGGLKVQL